MRQTKSVKIRKTKLKTKNNKFIKGGMQKTGPSVTNSSVEQGPRFLEEGGVQEIVLHSVKEKDVQMEVVKVPFSYPQLKITAKDNPDQIITYVPGANLDPLGGDFEFKYEIIDQDRQLLKVTITYKKSIQQKFVPFSGQAQSMRQAQEAEEAIARKKEDEEIARKEAEDTIAREKEEEEIARKKAEKKAARKAEKKLQRILLEKQLQELENKETEMEEQLRIVISESTLLKSKLDENATQKEDLKTVNKQKMKALERNSHSQQRTNKKPPPTKVKTDPLYNHTLPYVTTTKSHSSPLSVPSTLKRLQPLRMTGPGGIDSQHPEDAITFEDIKELGADTPPPPPPPSSGTTNIGSSPRSPPSERISTPSPSSLHPSRQEELTGRQRISRNVFDQRVENYVHGIDGLSPREAKKRVTEELKSQGLWYGDKVGGPDGRNYRTGGQSKKKILINIKKTKKK